MEDRNLTEKESLELISRMIKETRQNMACYAGYPFLIWGYLTTVIAVVVWFFMVYYPQVEIAYLWCALPVLGLPLTFYFNRKYNRKGFTTYMDRINGNIWIVFGCVAFVLSGFAMFMPFWIDIYFIIPLMIGMGQTITGCVIRYSPLIWLGAIGTTLSFVQLFIDGENRLLVFALIFILMSIIPGHLLNKKLRGNV